MLEAGVGLVGVVAPPVPLEGLLPGNRDIEGRRFCENLFAQVGIGALEATVFGSPGKLDEQSGLFMEERFVPEEFGVTEGDLPDQEVPKPELLEALPFVCFPFIVEVTVRDEPGKAHLFYEVIVLEALPKEMEVIDLLDLSDVEAGDPLLQGAVFDVVYHFGFASSRAAVEDENGKNLVHGSSCESNSLL